MRNAMIWCARLAGAGLVGLVALFVVGEGAPNPLSQPRPVAIEMAAMVVMVSGAAAGWKWPVVGGGLMLAGYICFQAVEVATHGQPTFGWAFTAMGITGLAYIGSALMPARR